MEGIWMKGSSWERRKEGIGSLRVQCGEGEGTMIMNGNLQQIGVVSEGQPQRETETEVGEATRITGVVTHSTGDTEPGILALLTMQEAQWSTWDIDPTTKL